MSKKKDWLDGMAMLEEKGVHMDTVLDALKEAIEKSYKKNYMCPEATVRVEINPKTFKISLFEVRTVVDDVNDEDLEMSIEEAKEINPIYDVGSIVETEVEPDVFGRLATSQVKQILRQKIREAEKEVLFNEYADKEGEIITGIVDRVEPKFAIINIGRMGAFLPIQAQIPNEHLYEGQTLKVYVTAVENSTKGTHVNVSRTDPKFVSRLFESAVPEIYEGLVEIKSVSREPGERSKIAVYAQDPNIDPVGSCVGQKGSRVKLVVDELNGEMIDIVHYSTDPEEYIKNALSPAEVLKVLIDEEAKSAVVIVPDNQLSLAIGKRGQNARLAVRLTEWKIDIKSLSEAVMDGLDLTDAPAVEEPLPEEIFETVDDEDEAIEMPTLDDEVGYAVITEDETEDEDTTMYDDDDDYEYEDDELSKYDEDIDYDIYDQYYDN